MESLHARSSSSELSPIALGGAAAGAAAGAVAWAAISYVTGYEFGYAAAGVGLLVGFAAVRLGGRGTVLAVAAAVLTVASIFAGKLLSTELLVRKEMSAAFAERFTPAFYEEIRRDAADWAQLSDPDEGDVRLFMVEHAYTPHGAPEDVERAELAGFAAVSVPALERMTFERPSFERWRDGEIAAATASFQAENPLVGLVVGDLGIIDLLFAFFAISTAFGIVARGGSEEQGGNEDRGSGSNTLHRAA